MAANAAVGPGVLTIPVAVPFDEALGWYEREGARFAGLVRQIDDPGRHAHGLDWTVAETAVHVLDVLRHYRRGVLGELTPEVPPIRNVARYVAAHNEQAIRDEPERRPGALADKIEDALDALAATIRSAGPDGVAVMDAGHRLSMTALLCGHIGEFLIHGVDIARSLNVPWPIDRRAAVLAVHATSAAIDLVFRAEAAQGLDVNAHVRLRGGENFAIRIAGGTVWTEEPQGKPDVVLSADPVAYLLLGFGRESLWRLVLRGKILGWGRRPWLLAKLPTFFSQP